MPVVRCVDLPFIRVEYDRTAPRREPAFSRRGSVAVAFTSQSRAVWEIGGKVFEGAFPASVSLTGSSDIVWHHWSEVSEAVEFQLHESWIEHVSGIRTLFQRTEPRVAIQDAVLQAVAARFCRDMSLGAIDPLKFETLATVAVRCLCPSAFAVERHSRISPLSTRAMRDVELYVCEHLGDVITLDALARVTATSLFHFAKRFKAATGTSPYAYVVGQRMIRAMQLLRTGRWTVAHVARTVGYGDTRQFRRQFVAHWNQVPGRLDR
jgi:AraC family transcriptional regulator